MNNILERLFAEADAEEQAEFINMIARETWVACGGNRGGGLKGFEMQMSYLSKGLNKDGRACIKELYEFIKLREEDLP